MKSKQRSISLCTFSVGLTKCGVPVDHVLEVVGGLRCTTVPLADRSVAGLINLRGQIVTAIDLRYLLEDAHASNRDDPEPISCDAEMTPSGKHVIVAVAKERFSLVVDDIGPVMRARPHLIESRPPNLSARNIELVTAVARMPSGPLLMLDLEHLRTR